MPNNRIGRLGNASANLIADISSPKVIVPNITPATSLSSNIDSIDDEFGRLVINLDRSSLLHIMGSSLAVSDSSRDACFRAVQFARDANKMVTFDPNLRPELLPVSAIRRLCKPVLGVSDVVMPSKEEAETLTGASDPVQAGQLLLRQGPRIAVVKLGEQGAVGVTREQVIRQPAFKVKEVDDTGAGDVFDGAFVVGLLLGWKLETALRFACAAGAIKVTRQGPMEGPTSKAEVEEFLTRNDQ